MTDFLQIVQLVLILSVLITVVFLYKKLMKRNQQKDEFIKKKFNNLDEKLNQLGNELAITKKEAAYNQLVLVVYQQLRKQEDTISQFIYDNVKGIDGINYLLAKIELKQTELFDKNKYNSKEEFKLLQLFELKSLIAIDSVNKLFSNSITIIETLEQSFASSTCSAYQLNLLKNIFSNNLPENYFKLVLLVIKIIGKRINNIPKERVLQISQKEIYIKEKGLRKKGKKIVEYKNKVY